MADGGLIGQETKARAGPVGIARAVIRYWALLGGLVLAGLVVMTAASALSNVFFNRPFRGDYEIVKHGVAIAAFSFLPWCQLTFGNVTVDIFTERMGARAKAAMVVTSSLVAAAFAILLLRQMQLGMFDYIRYREVMVSLPIPLWTAFPPALVSLLLLLVAALITAGENLREAWTGRPAA